MNDMYAEANAKRKTTTLVLVFKVFAILAIAMMFMIGMVSGGALQRVLIMVAAAGIVALIWYWPRFNVEWEYVFCDGQLDFDMIMGGEKRKNVLRVDMEEADLIAPMDSNRMAGYQHLTKKDYSSRRKDAKVYGIVVKLKNEKEVLVFEPSEKMLELMYQKSPNIVEK